MRCLLFFFLCEGHISKDLSMIFAIRAKQSSSKCKYKPKSLFTAHGTLSLFGKDEVGVGLGAKLIETERLKIQRQNSWL